MSYVTVDEAKGQLSIHPSIAVHDDRLTRLIAAAERWASGYLNAEVGDYQDSPTQSPPEIFEDIKSAILLHVEAEFDRDEKTFELLLQRARDLLWPHRVGLGV